MYWRCGLLSMAVYSFIWKFDIVFCMMSNTLAAMKSNDLEKR